MSNETYVTLVGSIYGEPELRFTPSGAPVTNLVIVVNARKYNKQSSEWERQPGKFWRCQAWSQGKMQLAENMADQIKVKDNVIAYGELVTREYEDRDGNKKSVDEVRIETIGKDLRWHAAPAAPAPESNTASGWGTEKPANNGWGPPSESSEPPF